MSWLFANFCRKVTSYLLETNSIALYKHITLETTSQKITRIYEDQSFPTHKKEYLYEEQYQEQHQNNKDQCLTKMFDKLLSKKKCNNPLGLKLLTWYLVVFIAIIYFFAQVGIILTFGHTLWKEEKQNIALQTINIILLFALGCDIVVQFRTGYLHKGMIVLQRQRVIAHYLRFRFQLDLLVIVVLAAGIALDVYSINYAKGIVILKFYRIYQFDQLFLRRLAVYRILKMIYVIIKQVIIIFVLSHIIGVIYYWIDYAELESGLCESNQSLCWLISSTAYSPIISLPWNLQYFYIIYWGVSTITTISYGDIGSNNPHSTIYLTFMMCFGFAVYAYIINAIIKVILWARSKSDKIKSEMILIDTYMKQIHIDSSTKNNIRQYLTFLYKEELDRNQELEEELKNKLPHELKLELVKNAYQHLYQSLQYMIIREKSGENLLFQIQERIYTTAEEVLTQGTTVNHLCFMLKGKAKLECKYHHSVELVGSIESSNEYVAQLEFFMKEKLGYTVYAEKSSTFYLISRETFEKESTENYTFRESFKLLEYQLNIRKKYTKVIYHCPKCREQHRWNQCPKVFPSFDKVALSSSLKSKEVGLQARMRGPKQKHHTLFHHKRLYELNSLKLLRQHEVYSRIERKIRRIRQQIQISKNTFEVDTAYEWSVYLPDENLYRIKQLVNDKKMYKRITRMPVFRPTSFK